MLCGISQFNSSQINNLVPLHDTEEMTSGVAAALKLHILKQDDMERKRTKAQQFLH